MRFSTWTYTSFNWIHDIWSKNNRKTVSLCIGEDLIPLALAIWTMGDGCKVGKCFKFSTNCFLYDKCLLLFRLLKDKKTLNLVFKWLELGINIIYIYEKNQCLL